MKQKLLLKSRYYRTIPIDKPGYAYENLILDRNETTLCILHCWNIGCPDGPKINMNYFVGMGFPETTKEGYRIMLKYIRPAMESARKAGILVSHVESELIMREGGKTQKEITHAGKQKQKTHCSSSASYYEKILQRAHGKNYVTESPLGKADRVGIFSPLLDEPFVFRTEEFDSALKKRGIKNIIYSGFATDMCILRAPGGVQSMINLGYRVYLLREATLGVEYPDMFKKKLVTSYAIRYFETHYGNTIGFRDFMRSING